MGFATDLLLFAFPGLPANEILPFARWIFGFFFRPAQPPRQRRQAQLGRLGREQLGRLKGQPRFLKPAAPTMQTRMAAATTTLGNHTFRKHGYSQAQHVRVVLENRRSWRGRSKLT